MHSPTYHPTPWTWEEHELSEGPSCIVYDANGEVIVDHLDRATAALIAASPTLHRFCLDLDRHLRRGAPGYEGRALRGTLTELEFAHEQLRKALLIADAEAQPQRSTEAEWREFCDRVYAELIARRPAPERGI